MAKKTPLAQVNDTFGGKDKLVDKLVSLLESDEAKDEVRKRLLSVSNSKLLHLHEVASMVKEKYGSRDKLLDAAAQALGRAKDKDYKAKLEGYSTAKLLDVTLIAERRARRASAATPNSRPQNQIPRSSVTPNVRVLVTSCPRTWTPDPAR
jgi:hypothetical protein